MRKKHFLTLTFMLFTSLWASAQSVKFDSSGRLKSITYADGVCYSIETSYHPAYAVAGIDNAFGDITIHHSVSYNGTVYPVKFINIQDNSTITSITFEEGFTRLEGFLSGCTGLTSVNLPNSLTEIDVVFAGSTSLSSIVIPKNVTTIGGIFANCIGLTSITIPNSVTSIKEATFRDCTGLKNVTFEENSQLTEIGMWVFSGCTSLTSVNLPNSLTVIGNYLFVDCTSLPSIVIPKSVTSIGGDAFWGCSGLKYVTFEENSQLTDIWLGAFAHSGIESLRLPASVKHIDKFAFCYCDELEEIVFPSSLKLDKSETTPYFGCKNLKHVYAYSLTPIELKENDFCETSRESGGYNTHVFGSVDAVLHVPEEAIDLYRKTKPWSNFNSIVSDVFEENGIQFQYLESNNVCLVGNDQVTGEYVIPHTTVHKNKTYDVTAIAARAFLGNHGLTKIVIPSSIKSIGENAFANCMNLTSIYSHSKVPVVLGATTTRAVGNSSVFDGVDKEMCVLYVPKGCVENYRSAKGWGEFTHIVEIPSLEVGDTFNADMNGVLGIFVVTGDKSVNLKKCGNVSNVVIPSKVTYNGVEYKITGILGTATGDVYQPNQPVFGSNVTTVEIPNTVTSIGACAFYYCGNLTSVTIPSSVTAIGDDAFLGCSKLSSITLPSNLQTIGEYAFSDCSLSNVTIPASVSTIGFGAFQINGIKVNTPDLTAFAKITPVKDRDMGTYGSFYPNWKLYLDNAEVTALTIPESVVSVGAIFAYCSSLTSVTFHKDVTEISTGAFSGCTNINKVVAYGKTPVNISGGIRFENAVKEKATLYVPKGTTAAYRSAGWTFTISNIVEVILGDVNSDDKLNGKDVKAIAKHIMGNTPVDFNVDAADINGDDNVNVADIVGLVNTIKYLGGGGPDNVEAVDLNLPSGTKWANMNVGAEKPEDYGLYFAWGETVGYTSDTSDGHSFEWANYKWCNDGIGTTVTKYCPTSETDYWGGSGTPDNLLRLEYADDAACVIWGGNWRMPTRGEIEELISETNSEWTTVNGVEGMKFTSKTNGNSIFLPAAGDRHDSDFGNGGVEGSYWSSSLYESGPYYAYGLYFGMVTAYRSNCTRGTVGRSVRPVRKN